MNNNKKLDTYVHHFKKNLREDYSYRSYDNQYIIINNQYVHHVRKI